MCLYVLSPPCSTEMERKEAASRGAKRDLSLGVDELRSYIGERRGALTHSPSHHSTEYKSINLDNNSGISIFLWQEPLCFFTQGQQ